MSSVYLFFLHHLLMNWKREYIIVFLFFFTWLMFYICWCYSIGAQKIITITSSLQFRPSALQKTLLHLIYIMPLVRMPFCLILIPCYHLPFLFLFVWQIFAYPFNFSKSFWCIHPFLVSAISRNAANVFSESIMVVYM